MTGRSGGGKAGCSGSSLSMNVEMLSGGGVDHVGECWRIRVGDRGQSKSHTEDEHL